MLSQDAVCLLPKKSKYFSHFPSSVEWRAVKSLCFDIQDQNLAYIHHWSCTAWCTLLTQLAAKMPAHFLGKKANFLLKWDPVPEAACLQLLCPKQQLRFALRGTVLLRSEIWDPESPMCPPAATEDQLGTNRKMSPYILQSEQLHTPESAWGAAVSSLQKGLGINIQKNGFTSRYS